MLIGSDLTVTQVVAAARHGEAVALAPAAIAAMRQARTVVEQVLNDGEPVYGLTTGVGERKAFPLDPAERHELASSVKGEGIEDRATMAPLSARRLAGHPGCAHPSGLTCHNPG